MKSILYIGNRLNTQKNNLSSIFTLGALLEKEGFNMIYASSKTNKLVRLMDMILTLVKNHKKVDWVLIDTYSTQNFYYAYIISQLSRLLQLRYITRINGGNLPHRLDQSPTMSKMVFNNSAINISPSKYLKNQFEKRQFLGVKYIPNSLEIDKYECSHKRFDQPRVLWVRSFSAIYNPIMAVKVINCYNDSKRRASLCMVGPDASGLMSQCEQLAKAYEVEVRFTGKLSKKHWIELSKGYNMFINTTNIDNMPMSVIEAMALGLPVISTNVGGMPYLIEDGVDGLLVPPDDEQCMAIAIERLMQDSQLRVGIIENARKKVEQFDWNVIKQQWVKILEN